MNLLLVQAIFLLDILFILAKISLAGDQRYSPSRTSDSDQYDDDEDNRDNHQHSRAPLFLPNSGFSGLLGGGPFGAPARTIIVPTSAAFSQPCCPCNNGFGGQGFGQQIPAASGQLLAGMILNI